MSLIYIPILKPKAPLRLLCFSYAGGNTATYLPWQKDLHANVELAVIQLPGRGLRLSDTPFRTMNEMVQAIFIALNQLPPKATIFFGHSMGARVAYELTLMLFRSNLHLPIQVIASGSAAPNIRTLKEKIHSLPDKEFIEKIKSLGGTPEEIIKNTELMELILPSIRADFDIIENYFNENNIILPAQVTVFAGRDDNLGRTELDGWFKFFEKKDDIHWINGDHFFVDKNRKEVLNKINLLLEITISELLKDSYDPLLSHSLSKYPRS